MTQKTMTKQKEVDKVLRHYLESVCAAVIGYKCHHKPRPCEEGDICPITNRLLPDFKKDLSKIGVMIKVGEMPSEGRGSLEDWSHEYVAVVPLREEKPKQEYDVGACMAVKPLVDGG